LAQNAAASVEKGQPVVVHGELRVREWKAEDGRTGKEVDVSAHTLGHDLRRGCGSFRKVTRASPALTVVTEGDEVDLDDLAHDDDFADLDDHEEGHGSAGEERSPALVGGARAGR
jgi:single-strand DNA-binding protein